MLVELPIVKVVLFSILYQMSESTGLQVVSDALKFWAVSRVSRSHTTVPKPFALPASLHQGNVSSHSTRTQQSFSCSARNPESVHPYPAQPDVHFCGYSFKAT